MQFCRQIIVSTYSLISRILYFHIFKFLFIYFIIYLLIFFYLTVDFIYSILFYFESLVPIAACVSTENVLRKEVRTAFDPHGGLNWIDNLEEKGKFSSILITIFLFFNTFIVSCFSLDVVFSIISIKSYNFMYSEHTNIFSYNLHHI